jgi:hypothetical protein
VVSLFHTQRIRQVIVMGIGRSRPVLDKRARIAGDVLGCASCVTNQYRVCLFGVQDVVMGVTWSMHYNGLEVVKAGRPCEKFVQPAVAIDAILCPWSQPSLAQILSMASLFLQLQDPPLRSGESPRTTMYRSIGRPNVSRYACIQHLRLGT